MQVTEALDRYIVQLAADGRSDHTLHQAARHVRLFARYIGKREIAAIRTDDVATFLSSAMACRTARGSAKRASSMNAMRSSLRAFFAFAHAAGVVASNPAALVRRARVGPSTPRGLTAAERDKLLAALAAGAGPAARRDHVLFALMLAVGLRVGSALGLELGDIDFQDRSLRVRTLKGGGAHTVYMPEAVAAALRDFVGDRRSGPVFRGGVGDHLSSRQTHRRLADAAKRAGIRPIGPHQLRHAFAVALYERVGDVLLVQAALGHRSIASTVIYARCSSERVRQAVGATL